MSTNQHTKRNIYIYILLIFLVLILGTSLISCQDAGAGGSNSSQGTSSVPPPIDISDQAGLEAMANDLSKNYILQNDITISTDNWTALGTASTTPFSGQLDGNGHVISIEAKTTGGKVTWDGLFYQLSSASEGAVVVKNLDFKTVSDLKFVSSNTGVLTKNLTQGVVENIALYGSGGTSSTATIDANVAAEISNLGGLIGQISSSNKVELNNISANINMTRSDTNKATNVGGLVGSVNNSNALLDSISVKGTLTFPTTNSDYIGGILGYAKGTLSQAVSSVNVIGEDEIGSLVGRAESGSLRNVYASGTTNGTQYVGGLVGNVVSASINFALALGKVTATNTTSAGGLVGTRGGGVTASNAFYDSTTTGQTSSALGTAKSTDELKKAATFANFDTLSFWIIKDGSYPKLYLEEPSVLHLIRTNHQSIMANIFEFEFSEPISVTNTSFTLNGNDITTNDVTTTGNIVSVTTSPSETSQNTFAFNVTSSTDTSETLASSYKFYYYHNKDNDEYYDVSSCAGLQGIGNLLSTKFELVQDIDCDDSKNWNSGAGFDPIGDGTYIFTGTLLGNGFKISKLYINRPSTRNVSLIAINNGTIENLGLVDATIKSTYSTGYVGILASRNYGTAKKVYTSGSVEGAVVGGVLGYNDTGTLSLSYSTATVNGTINAGGLSGANSSTISESYAAGVVTGTASYVGGLIGISNGDTVERSYYDTEVSGQSDTGKGEGKSTADMKKAATYVGWDTSVWNLVNGAYPTFK